jgi:hypothetical protein
MTADDRAADGFAIGGFLRATFEDGVSRWRGADNDCDLDLTFTDAHQRYEIFELMGSGAVSETERAFTSSSIAMAGTVSGTIRIGDATWDIDGTGSRDHSWGNRHVGVLANWTWLTGGFDNGPCFAVGSMVTRTGEVRPGGFILHDGQRALVTGADIVLGMELDGITLRNATITVETDEFGAFTFEALGFAPNMLLDLGTTYLESFLPSVLRWNGRTTTASFGVGLNPRGGTMPVPRYLNAVHANGISY